MEGENVEKKPDIVTVTLSDGVERDYIDTHEKLCWIINDRYQVQQNDHENVYIDLSYLVIALGGIEGKDFMMNFFLERRRGLEGFVQLKEEGKNIDNIENVRSEVKYRMDFSNSILCRVSFEYTRFLKKVIFNNTKILDKVDFSNSIFYDEVYFSNLIFLENLGKEDLEKLNSKTVNTVSVRSKRKKELVCDFTMSKFNGDVLFEEYETKEEKTNVNMLSHFKIDGSHFNKKLKIINAAIGDISMQNCHFNDTVNISLNKYDALSNIDFSFSTINCLFFIDSDLGGQKGEPIKLSKEISFEKSLITKDAFVFLRNINRGGSYNREGTLNFEYANILGTITIQDSKLKLIKLDKSTIIGDINIEKVETDYDSRESIAKVKDSFLKRNDIVNSLTYKAKEMNYYSDALSKHSYLRLFRKNTVVFDIYNFTITSLIRKFIFALFDRIIMLFLILPIGILVSIIPCKSLEKVREYTLLYLNRISNSFGMSWGRGVFFTCITASSFFILINTLGIASSPDIKSSPLFVWGWNGWHGFSGVWNNYLHMFYLLDFKDKFSESIKLNAMGETLFFVSKIFVSYGIYQTISAFRKYGK